MTSFPILPPPARLFSRTNPSVPAVVALLLSVLAAPAFGQGTATMPPIIGNASTVDSVVSKVNGPVLDVFAGVLQIDVTNAKITGGDDRLASPVPWSGILPGSRIVAQVTVPEVIPAVFPPRLAATSVVVFLANSGSLSGMVQGVNTSTGTFTLLYTTVKTNAGTQWSGTKPDGGPVKGLEDLSMGMQANVSVTADGSGVTAKSVFAHSVPTTRIVAFRGKVEKIDGALWTIDEHLVQVTPETKIVGDPKVGDTVDVLEKVTIVPPGMGMPTPVPVAISITKVVIIPPPPPGRTVEFDGVVESLPLSPIAVGVPLGHWTISTKEGLKDVLVTGLTKVESGIVKGSAVHVKGVTLPMAVLGPSNASQQILAIEITKR